MEPLDYCWLECEVGPGLWDVERSVTFREAEEFGGRSISIAVDLQLVRVDRSERRGERVPGRFRVLPVAQSGDTVTVMLPVQSVERGMYVGVPSGRLAAG